MVRYSTNQLKESQLKGSSCLTEYILNAQLSSYWIQSSDTSYLTCSTSNHLKPASRASRTTSTTT